MRTTSFLTLLGFILVGLGVQVRAQDEPLRVFVSIPPMMEVIQSVGGEHVQGEIFLQPGESPATYQPGPRQIAALAEADVFFSIGVPFERQLLERLRRSMPDLRIVDAAAQVEKATFDGEHTCGGHGHDHHDHDHGALDPHVWMDPRNMALLAAQMAETLSARAPEKAAIFEANRAAYAAQMQALYEACKALLEPAAGRTLFVYHPAYGYFTRAFGMEQVAIEHLGQRPSPAQLAELIAEAKQASIRAIFIQRQFDTRSAKAVADAVGAQVVPLDPLSADYSQNLRTMAATVARYLSPEAE